jgi:copper transport protein
MPPVSSTPGWSSRWGIRHPVRWLSTCLSIPDHPVPELTQATFAPDGGTWLVDALMAVDRLVVSTGLLVLVGGAGFVAVARLPTPAWRLTRRIEGRAWLLLRVAGWAALLGTLAGLLLRGPLTATVGTRFGVVWAARVVLLLLLVAFLRAWSEWEAPWTRAGAWVALGMLAAALVLTPPLGGHAAAGPHAAAGVAVGVLHFSAAAVWFGGLVLLGTCVLPHADEGLLAALPRFSSVAFTAMVVTVVSGVLQGWRQLGSVQAVAGSAYGRLLLAKVAVFVVLIAVAARSRVLVRRRLAARVLVGTAAQPEGHEADAGSVWLLRRLVLAEIATAIVVLAVTALLGIATPPSAA